MVPNHGTQYKENTSTHQGGMHEDGQTDWRMDGLTDELDPFYIPQFHLRRARINKEQNGKNSYVKTVWY